MVDVNTTALEAIQFLDSDKIGIRSKVINDEKVDCLFEKVDVDCKIITSEDEKPEGSDADYILVSEDDLQHV
jgi:hypothetical protein